MSVRRESESTKIVVQSVQWHKAPSPAVRLCWRRFWGKRRGELTVESQVCAKEKCSLPKEGSGDGTERGVGTG